MGLFSIIYTGPSADDDAEAARNIAGAIATRWPLSDDEAFRRLSRTPFALLSGLTRDQAVLYRQYLEGFGASVQIVSSQEEVAPRKREAEADSVARPRNWYFRHAWRAALSALAAGMLLSSVFVVAGGMIVFLAPILAGPGLPLELITAAGWTTIAFGIFILIGVSVIRLKELLRIVSPPDLSTPLRALQSCMRAINDRNWDKALRCLAARPGSKDLGTLPRNEVFNYFRTLSRRFVLPRTADPAYVTIFQEGNNAVTLRVQLDVLSREPSADGSYLRRTFVESRRFQRRGGCWFLVDGFLLGQPDPSLLPQPACPECGANSEPGRRSCGSCGAYFPVPVHTEERLQPPRRKPDLAALMSAVVPGLGQAYNGQPLKGLLIAATFWAILPWAAGVVDALRTAARINRNASFHDLPSRPTMPVILHLAMFAAAAVLVLAYPQNLGWIGSLLVADVQDQESREPIYREPEGRFTVLFPRDWEVGRERDEEGRPIVRAVSEDESSTVRIASRKLPEFWEPCRQMRNVIRRLEEEGAAVKSWRCGFIDERLGYRLDSYSADGRWRHSLFVIAVEEELFDIAFVCPVERQDELKPLFERVINSLQFKEPPPRY